MDLPFEVYVDGQRVKYWHVYTPGEHLTARVLPQVEWADTIKELIGEPVHLSLFATPVPEYRDLEKQILDMKDTETNMGDMPTLIGHGQSEIITDLQPGFLYDICAFAQSDYIRVYAGGGRLPTQKGTFPDFMTLDELKLCAIEALDLSLMEANKITAKITLLTGWAEDRRNIYAVFEFGQKEPGKNYGVIVQHDGVVHYKYGHSKKELRAALRV